MGSLGNSAVKLLGVKVGGVKKSPPLSPCPCQTTRPEFNSDRVRIILKVYQTITLHPFDLQNLYYLYGKIKTPLQCKLEIQEAGSI